jgi:hypothetical protein
LVALGGLSVPWLLCTIGSLTATAALIATGGLILTGSSIAIGSLRAISLRFCLVAPLSALLRILLVIWLLFTIGRLIA